MPKASQLMSPDARVEVSQCPFSQFLVETTCVCSLLSRLCVCVCDISSLGWDRSKKIKNKKLIDFLPRFGIRQNEQKEGVPEGGIDGAQ